MVKLTMNKQKTGMFLVVVNYKQGEHMKNYTVHCEDKDGFIEEIDLKAVSIKEARSKAKQAIKDEYCNSLKIVKIVKHDGTWL